MITDYYADLILKTLTVTTNEYGDIEKTYTESTFKGLINQATSTEKALFNQYPADTIYKLFCDTSTLITRTSIVSDGTNDYIVISVPKDTIGRGHHYKVMLQKIDV